jgi:hypothetical protein
MDLTIPKKPLYLNQHLRKGKQMEMKSKSFLVTVYYRGSDLVADTNQSDYDYDLSTSKVIRDHLEEINEDASIVDVAIDTNYPRILEVMDKQINDPL